MPTQSPQSTIGFGYGGAIANRGTLTFSDSLPDREQGPFWRRVFCRHYSTMPGGIRRTTFGRNEASELGGGLCAGDTLFPTGATVTVTDSVFRNNTAAVSGGGAYRFKARLVISNSSFTDNLAKGVGARGSAVACLAEPAFRISPPKRHKRDL